MAAHIFAELKWRGVNCELVTEYAKDAVWGETTAVLKDQAYVWAKQNHRINRLLGKVNVVVTDSPTPTSLLYTEPDFYENFPDLVLEAFERNRNLNVLIERDKPYNPHGRMQTEEEAKMVDEAADTMLHMYDIPHYHVKGTREAVAAICQRVLAELHDK
jgi:hypothetical protein